MEEPRFDLLLRKAAEQTSRRQSLGVLLGGALLLGNPGESEATDKAKRRRKRKRRRKGASSASIWRDVSFWVNNRAGTATASGVYGAWFVPRWIQPGNCTRDSFQLAPGDAQRYFANTNLGYVWLNEHYFFSFENPFVGLPTVTAAYGGRSSLLPEKNCPSPVGTDVLREATLDVGDEIPITLDGKVFRVKRYGDTSSNKIFEIIVPAGL